MENKEHKASEHDYSIDEILAETRGRFGGKSYAELIGEAESEKTEEKQAEPAQPDPPVPPAPKKPAAPPAEPVPEKQIPKAPAPEITRPQAPEMPQPSQPSQNGVIRFEEEQEFLAEEEPEKKKGFFSRRQKKKKKNKGFDEEEDIYYGLQLKNIEEYRKGYNDDSPQELTGPTSTFSYLFDDTQESDVDAEIAERFSKIHEERAKRISSIAREAKEEPEDIFSIYSHSKPDRGSFESALEKKKSRPVEIPVPKPKQIPKTEPQERTVEFKVQKLEKAASPAAVSAPVPEPAKQEEMPEQFLGETKEIQEQPGSVGSDKAPETTGLQEEAVVKTEELHPEELLSEKDRKKKQIKELMDKAPSYRPAARNVHVLEIENIGAALEHEAQSYVLHTQDAEQDAEPGEEVHSDPEQKRRKFSFLGEDEEENDPSEEIPEEPEELDDYQEPADAPSILHELNANSRKLMLRLTVTGIASVLLLVLGLICERGELLPIVRDYEFSPLAYFIINLSFVIIAVVFSLTAVLNGIKGLFKLHANSDSAIAVACLAVLIQSAAVFFAPDAVMNSDIHLYSVLAVGGLFLNTAGKVSMVRRISRNFHFIASPEPKLGVELFDDHNTALQLAKGCVADAPVIAYQRKTKFFKHFLHNSYEADPSEQASQSIAPIAFIASLALCIAVLFLSKDVVSALTAFTAAACISAPFTNMLAVNLPVSRLCKLARRCGTMLVGYRSVEHFCNTNALMLDAKDLFPKGTVILNGIKTFGGQRIDDAIVDATAVMCAAGGPLSDLFDQIIKSHRDMLPKIDNLSYEDERGVVGWVSGRRILVGNRELMREHSVEPPSRDYEKKYLLGGKQVVYLASGGELVAMFILSYNSDKRRALELQRMENNGISLIVRTCDPNVTPEFLAQCFRLDVQSIRVLPERLGNVYQKLVEEPVERANALFATKGRPTTMMRMLTACVRQKGNVSIAVVLQNVCVVLGFVLVAFLACYSGLQQLSTTSLLLYELFWLIVILVIPRLRKP